MKNYSLQSNWFVYCPTSCLLLVSSGPLGNCLQPYLFGKNGQLLRLAKFEVELPGEPPKPARLCLAERDVTPTTLYGSTMVLVLKHFTQGRASNTAQVPNSEIVVYTLSKDAPARKTHILQLEASGKLAVSCLDNLVVVHHQASRTSSIFDINLPSESDGRVLTMKPFVASASIRPYYLRVPAAAAVVLQSEPPTEQISCELYSPNWVFFQPNIIIDAILGCLWTLELDLTPLVDWVGTRTDAVDRTAVELFNFLLQRTDSKGAVTSALCRLLRPPCDVAVVGRILDKLNESYRIQLDIEMQSQIAMPATASPMNQSQLPTSSLGGLTGAARKPSVVVDQSDVFSLVLVPLATEGTSGIHHAEDRDRFVVAIVNEYIRSLVQYHIPVQHVIYEMLIEALARLGQFYQLHQLFQYHAVADSKPLVRVGISLTFAWARVLINFFLRLAGLFAALTWKCLSGVVSVGPWHAQTDRQRERRDRRDPLVEK